MPLGKMFSKKFIYTCGLKFLLTQSKFSGYISVKYAVPYIICMYYVGRGIGKIQMFLPIYIFEIMLIPLMM